MIPEDRVEKDQHLAPNGESNDYYSTRHSSTLFDLMHQTIHAGSSISPAISGLACA